ncbi:MAG: type II toxin-antitoxin system RelE/ParE family toxin [Planctomycetota bacterium]|nr:type II toxin-antitoxin system RelE/ParE family toxin [Planctomycetota bacterium]
MEPSNNPLRIELSAALEADELALWFLLEGPEGLRGEEAALRYYDELEDVYQRVQAFPETYAFFEGNWRRAYFTKMPCIVFYEVEETETIVYSVAHSKEDDQKIRARLQEYRNQGLEDGPTL